MLAARKRSAAVAATACQDAAICSSPRSKQASTTSSPSRPCEMSMRGRAIATWTVSGAQSFHMIGRLMPVGVSRSHADTRRPMRTCRRPGRPEAAARPRRLMSHACRCGRGWSTAGGGQASSASIAALPPSSARVGVGPPLSCSVAGPVRRSSHRGRPSRRPPASPAARASSPDRTAWRFLASRRCVARDLAARAVARQGPLVTTTAAAARARAPRACWRRGRSRR